MASSQSRLMGNLSSINLTANGHYQLVKVPLTTSKSYKITSMTFLSMSSSIGWKAIRVKKVWQWIGGHERMTTSMAKQRSFFRGVFGLPNHHTDSLNSFTNIGRSLFMVWSCLISTSLIYTRRSLVRDLSSTGKSTMIFQYPSTVILNGRPASQQQRNYLKACGAGKPNLPLGGSA